MGGDSEFNVGEPGGPVGLPSGAVEADEWQPEPLTYRVVFGATRDIEGMYDLVGNLRSTVIQLADGTVDDGSSVEPPLIHVSIEQGSALTATQARGLAQLLNTAATEVEQMRYPAGGPARRVR